MGTTNEKATGYKSMEAGNVKLQTNIRPVVQHWVWWATNHSWVGLNFYNMRLSHQFIFKRVMA